MNHFSKVFVASLASVVVIALSTSGAMAGTGGRVPGQSARYMYSRTYTLAANVGYTIRATASGASDPVLHVQSRPSGDFLAGNDDYNGTRSSSVTIPAVGYARDIWIVVRAYSNVYEGIATLEIDPTVGSTIAYQIAVKAGTVNYKTYQPGSHFFTVEEQGGSNNTIILALSGTAANAIAFDDDDGVGAMSWIHTPVACTSNCKILVGQRFLTTDASTTYMWDDDVHINDSDGDGASNALEAALTTDPYLADTDEDGLEDMAEVMGVDTADELLRLPFYGADPKKPDVFVQADWLECVYDPAKPTLCGNPRDPDLYQFKAASATGLRAKYFDPDFAGQPNNLMYTHVDNGLENTNPATRTESGLWGGASRHTSHTTNKCEWKDQTRDGYFHFARVFKSAGQVAGGDHICLDISNDSTGGAAAHELGHNLNLSHSGSQSGTVEMNCKPNYRSLMNYGIDANNHVFSSGQLMATDLNPTVMSEHNGLGTTNATLLDHIDVGVGAPLAFVVGGTAPTYTGEIDWNRDGEFSPVGTTVRAAPNWSALSCDIGNYQADQGVWSGRAGTAFAWIPTTSGDRLYWFTRNESTNYIEYRYATDFPENCGTPPQADCKTTWVPALTQSASVLSSSVASGPPAVARYWDTSNLVYKLLLVYPDNNNLLRSRIFTPTGHGYWSTPVSMPGGIAIQGDVAAATYQDRAYAYASAASGATLYKWSLSNAGAWTGPSIQYWAGTGNEVRTPYGIGATSGQYRPGGGSAVTRMFAAIPLVTPLGKLVFAWNDAYASNTWTLLPDSDWAIGLQYAKAQPGLAYVPFNPDVPTGPGRFYLAWTRPNDGDGDQRSMLFAMTEGNEQVAGVAPRQLRWEPAIAELANRWSYGKANNSLHYDLAYDRNLRAAFTLEYGTAPSTYRALTFEPYADGIFDNVIGDQDDYPILRFNLDACFGAHAFY